MHRWIDRGKSITTWFTTFLPVFTFFWIWALTFVFFIRGIDIKGLNVSIIKIIYVTLALVCVVLFQFSRETWRKIIIQFWSIVIFYVLFVFVLSLLFQIPSTRNFIKNLGITSEWQKDIGLHVYQMSELILFLLFEVLIIIIIVILQILFKRTSIVASIHFGFVEKLVEILDTFFDITKLTIFGIIMTCISKVNVVNFLIVIAAVVSMVLKRTYRYVIIQLISVSAALILLLQMTMQLNNLQDSGNVTCTVRNSSVLISRGQWIGIGKVVMDGTMFYNVVGYIWIIVLVTVHTIVVKEENIIAGLRQDSGWNPHKMFNDSTYIDADKDFGSFTKYLLKYGFYRYGIEFTYICIVLLIQARLDAWAFIYCIWLMIFILSSSHFLPTVWFLFKGFAVFIIPLQYASALGLWPQKCFGFQWEDNELIRNAFLWLYLPLGNTKPDAYKLFWDLIVFLFVLCQANVFEFERENASIDSDRASPSTYVPPDVAFVTKPRNTFGVFRYALFSSLPIISAITLFLAATSTVTIFSVGYGIGFAIILWSTDTYFTDPFDRLSKLWRYLIIFSVIMIFIKILLQIPACIFMDILVEHSCWIVQLLGMSCLRISTRTIAFLKVPLWNTAEMTEKSCWYLPTTVGIEWDVCCFISLMFHNRFLHSNYYEEMAKQANLNAKFSDRAAKILEEFNDKELRDMRQKYLKNLEKIQKNMERLHQAQKRIRGIKISEPVTHQEAVTSGDYYMFHDSDKPKKLDIEIDEEQRSKEEPDSPHTPSVGKFMETVLTNDIEEALRLADGSTPSKSSSLKSSKSSPDSGKSKKCFKCECFTKEAIDLSEKMKAEEYEAEKKKASEVEGKLPKETKVTSRKPSKTQVIVENEKLKPTIDYRKTTIPPKLKQLGPSSSKVSQPDDGKCACGCENCRCDASIWFTIRHCFLLFLKFVRAFVISCMSSLCQLFNKLAHDYRHIKRELEKEKERDKSPSSTSLVASPVSQRPSKPKDSVPSQPYQVPIYIRLLMSTYDLILSHFNTVCFFSVLLLQMKNPTLCCLPLTMMVLFWGSLSVPRPTKRFWKIILTYTTCVLILECIVRSVLIQYDYQWMRRSKTYQLNELFGIDKREDNTIYYLIVILAVFLQRRLLINIGLWSIEPPLERGRNLFSTGIVSIKNFFRKLLYDRYNRIPTDVYTSIFLCDFVNIFVFIFGFAAVTEKNEVGVTRYLAENKIPPWLLVLFIIQCLMIFIDRWIYLRKHVVAKLIFQFVQIVIVHFCLFLLLPATISRRFKDLFFPSLWYSIKCIYLLLSAYQIRCGYSASAHGHVLCQSYNVVNMYVYQIYLVVPFVYELRAVTDWMWTETTLTLSEWIGMEDIFCTVFQLKCWRNYDNKYSYPRGQKVTNSAKFIAGGGVVLLFFLVLLFPLAFFAFGRVAGRINIPQQMEISFRIGSYQPLFKSYSSDIKSLETSTWSDIKDFYRFYSGAVTFLSEYDADDVGVVRFSNYSAIEWTFSPSFRDELIHKLQSSIPVKMVAEWSLHRKTENTRQSNIVNGAQSVYLSTQTRQDLLQIIEGNKTLMTVDNICPKFLKVSSLSTSQPVEALMIEHYGSPIPVHGNLSFQIQRDYYTWWEVFENYTENDKNHPKNIICSVDNYTRESSEDKDIIIMTFNDKIFPPGIFSYFSAQGIIGLYTSFLISLGFIIRRLCRGRTNQVFLDYLPNVDSILQLLLDIYFVREHRDSKLEEDLYAKLIFLFRSPETLIRWTRKPEDSD